MGRDLTISEWMQLFSSLFTDTKPSILCFAGKEVFFNDRSVSILLDTIKLRNKLQNFATKNKKTEIGVISNGTLIHNYKKELTFTQPDYFDISIDGLPETHNFVRGKNAFEKLKPNLIWLLDNFPNKVWITHTLLDVNIVGLPSFIKYYHQYFKINKFSIGFYKEMKYTDPSLKLDSSHYYNLIDNIFLDLQNLSLNGPIEVIIDLDLFHTELIDALGAAGWINPVEPISSILHDYDNGLNLRINTARVPVGLSRSVRITPQGYWLASEDLVKVREYSKFAVNNVRNCNYDTEILYHNGLQSDRYYELQNQHVNQF